jgi:hypothetical protein
LGVLCINFFKKRHEVPFGTGRDVSEIGHAWIRSR